MTRDESTKLTKQQKKFCEEYVKCWSPTTAYRIAFKKDESHTASYAYYLLQLPHIVEHINLLREKLDTPIIVELEMVVLKLQEIAFGEESSHKDKLKALDILQKILDKHNLTVENDGINIVIKRKD
jgi:phage terminase small subunit